MRKAVWLLLALMLLPALLLLMMMPAGRTEGFPPTSTPTIPGIDVSAGHGEINWAQVYASGVRIAMIRATEGAQSVDARFRENALGARAAGIHVGYCHFLTAQTEAEALAQADFFLSVIDGYETDCLLALDAGSGAGLAVETLSRCALAFLARVEERTGLGVMLHTDAWAARARYTAEVAKYPIWVANHGAEAPEPNGQWIAWVGFQYGDRGEVPGIAGCVNLDAFTYQVYQIEAPAAPSPEPIPTPTDGTPGVFLTHRQWPEAVTAEEASEALGMEAAQLTQWNPLPGGMVQAGQLLRYPVTKGIGDYAGLHILQPRECLATLARRYGVSAAELSALNGLPEESAPTGQVLRVPAFALRTGPAAPPPSLPACALVVQAGQTLPVLAALCDTTAEALADLNGLRADAPLRRGQVLRLTDDGTDAPRLYVVNHGDTLCRIAAWFGCTAEEIYAQNNIDQAHLIHPGQILVLPEEGSHE